MAQAIGREEAVEIVRGGDCETWFAIAEAALELGRLHAEVQELEGRADTMRRATSPVRLGYLVSNDGGDAFHLGRRPRRCPACGRAPDGHRNWASCDGDWRKAMALADVRRRMEVLAERIVDLEDWLEALRRKAAATARGSW